MPFFAQNSPARLMWVTPSFVSGRNCEMSLMMWKPGLSFFAASMH
jgi:hypothetical protein